MAAWAAEAHATWDPVEAVRDLRLQAAWLQPPISGARATPGSADRFPACALACQSWVRRAIADALRALDLFGAATLDMVACEFEAIQRAVAASAARGKRLSEFRGGTA